MGRIHLHEFKGKDAAERLACAADYLRAHPGSTLTVDPGNYILSTDRARKTQAAVMNGEYGRNPQSVMFRPEFEYDRGLDLDGVSGCKIEAYGAKFIIDGFMEPISLRNCTNVEIKGLTIDHRRRPYSRGTVKSADGNKITVTFGESYPITPGMPYMRACLCDRAFSRLESFIGISAMEFVNEREAVFEVSGSPVGDISGRELYIWHTFHSRPAILMENAKNIIVKDVTVNSHPGMGVTAHCSENICFTRLRVVPADGECMSTNTDATHIASCRGRLTYDGCLFAGQGDDGLNVHTYYHTVLKSNGSTVRCKAFPPDGTHTQVPDTFRAGDTLEKVSAETLEVLDTFKAVSVTVENGENTVTLDRPFGNAEGVLIADRDAVPSVEIVNCTMKNHLARGILLKCSRAAVDNCRIEGTFCCGIVIAPEASWKEGIASENVTVRNCVIKNCGTSDRRCGGIFVYAECADRSKKVHGKITVENCKIDCPDAECAVILENAKEIIQKNNAATPENIIKN